MIIIFLTPCFSWLILGKYIEIDSRYWYMSNIFHIMHWFHPDVISLSTILESVPSDINYISWNNRVMGDICHKNMF